MRLLVLGSGLLCFCGVYYGHFIFVIVSYSSVFMIHIEVIVRSTVGTYALDCSVRDSAAIKLYLLFKHTCHVLNTPSVL